MIKEHKYINDYDLTKLHVDPTNENELVGKDKDAHEKSLEERGLLGIILIDQNDMIVNGTHTVQKMIKAGNTTGPVIRKHYKNQAERIVDRQILNYGPRGKPIRELQKENLLKIQKSGGLENFVKLMNQSKDEMLLRKDGLIRQEKPLELPRKFIMHYTLPGEMVIDLFGGSGSTMIACEHLQRNCLTMEKDPGVCDKIIQRYEEFTQLKAELIC